MTKLTFPYRYLLPGLILLLGVALTSVFLAMRSGLLAMPGMLFISFGLTLLVASSAWIVLEHTITRRIGRLIDTTTKLAAGQIPAAASLSGSDDLAILSRGLDATAARICFLNSGLRDANERVKIEVSERTFIEESLRNSERRFRSLWENSLDAMRLTDSKGSVLAINAAYATLMGQQTADLIGRPFTEAYQGEGVERQLADYQEQFEARSIQHFRLKKVTLRSGQPLDLEVSYSFVELEHDQPLVLGIFRDVTERMTVVEKLREAKEFSESLISTANVMIVGLDKDDRITIFNNAAEQVSGFREEEVLGKLWTAFVQRHESLASSDASTPLARKTFEAKLLTKAGEERLISWQTNAIVGRDRCSGAICFGIDITERTRQEEQRLALERKLLDSQKLESLGVLAGGIAHDFNNLLAAILGNTNLAQMQLPATSPASGYLTNVEKTSLRAADLCRQMLAYSGKGRFAVHSLDLNDVVRETLELLEVSITKKAALRVELRPGVSHVMADPAQIRQVIMNLVINASEAIGDNSGLIRIRTGMLEADAAYFHNAAAASEMPAGEYIFLEVIDSGCGMSPETQARIFEPFYTTKFTGRGLGLAAVLGIVRGHNGALKITSEVGHGSSFKLVLPAVKALPPPQPTVTRGSTARWKGEGTILVVDDDPTVRAVTSRMVEAFGFNVLQAVDGLHGVEVFSEKQDTIRAVVLDMTMPKLNGSEALQQMRRIRPEVKVLMVSGFCEQPSGVVSQRSGPDGFLQKPYKPDELASKLRSLFAESPVASAGHNNGANQKLGMVSHN